MGGTGRVFESKKRVQAAIGWVADQMEEYNRSRFPYRGSQMGRKEIK
jgi:hypothetical protein